VELYLSAMIYSAAPVIFLTALKFNYIVDLLKLSFLLQVTFESKN